MKRTNTTLLALVCYLIPILGPVYLLVQERDDRFARVHARQMLALDLLLIALFAAWVVSSWILGWIPTAGALLGAMLFAFVIVGLIAGVGLWVTGLIQALQGNEVALPIVSNVSRRLFAAED
ncbi:MAG: DUF4870 domain-containing protein [Anaerolineae bacterium]|nr:DUF4870 domain-containing protein [Anaerolineae bacterium]